MGIVNASIFVMIFNLIYSKWLANKSKNNSVVLFSSLIIVFQKLFLIFNKNIEIIISVSQISIVVLLTILKSKKNKFKYVFLVLNSVMLGIVSGLYFFDKILYSQILFVILLIVDIYGFSIISYKNEFKIVYKLIIGVYFLNICINLLLSNLIKFSFINNFFDFVLGVVILVLVFEENFKFINSKNINLKSNLQISNIQLEKNGEKFTLHKELTSKMKKIISKKEVLLEEISNSTNRCIIIIDDFEHISTKDKSFSNIWTSYKSKKGSLSLDSFLRNNVLDKEKFIQALKDCKRYNKKVEIEFRDNLERHFKANFSKLQLNSNYMGVMCAIEDITYKKNAETKILENNIKYKKIVDNIPYSIVIVKNDEIVYKNNDYIDFKRESVKNRIINCKENDEIELLYGDENIYFQTQKSAFSDKDGKKEVIALKDITEYKDAIRNLKISKERYKQLVDLIPEGIYTQDFENNSVSYVNSSLFDMFKTNDLEKIDFVEINKDINITSPNLEKIKFTRKKMKNNFGDEIFVEVGCMLIDVDKKLKIVGIVRNITEQVKSEFIELEIEKKKAEYKIKSEFFVNISHELKTPLNVISSSNQLLEILHKEEIKNNPNGKISTVVETVKKYSNIIMGLVDNIMDLAKLELNLYENNVDLYNAVDLIEDLVIEFNNYMEKKDISIIFDTDEEEKIIKIDPEYIERAISILLTLIVKYSKKESLINVDLTEKNKNTLLIQIKNEGGYDYNKYVNDRDRRSLDIGLDIVKQIINIYDAKIDIKTTNKTMKINIEIKTYSDVFEYKTKQKNQNNNDVYYRCLNI